MPDVGFFPRLAWQEAADERARAGRRDDPYLLEAPANVTDEERFLAVGMIAAKHWMAVYTYGSDRVRIIAVRRARKQEIDHYESE